MAVDIRKYNPGFLTDEDIVASFCVRTGELESLLESLRGNTGNSNVHSLVIGPRGSGKTHLLLRVAAEIRRDPSLAGFFPIVFAEESYEVSTTGEFWLECLGRLVDQAPEDDWNDLRLSYNDLRSEDRDKDLATRCLGAVLDFAERQDKRMVLIVENLNSLFSDMVDPDAGWRLRHTLQNEPRIILVGSATSRFDEIDSPEHALYDLFRVVTLRPLDTEECAVLWQTISGQHIDTRGIRPLEILTGGNPRLLAIVARFGAGRSFRELMDNLLDLVDDHTEYFRSHLEALPPQERRVYLALAKLWKPATSREVADQARLDTNVCSAVLKRLEGRGAVVVEGGSARRRQYYLTERMYNIYYLLRRDSGSSRVVEALIDFMVCLYSPADLWDVVMEFYGETELATADVQEPVARVLINKAQLLADLGHEDEAIAIYEYVGERLRMSKVSAHQNQAVVASLNKVLKLNLAGRYHEGIQACDHLLSSFGTSKEPAHIAMMGLALDSKGRAWGTLGNIPEAVHAYDQALEKFAEVPSQDLDPLVADTMLRKGLVLLGNLDPTEAVVALDDVMDRFSTAYATSLVAKVTGALIAKAAALHRQRKTLPDTDIFLLLDCLSKEGDLRPGLVQGLTALATITGLSRTLEVIQESPTAGLLLPLVTALQQELGQETLVAKEVDEVAADVRRNLADLTTTAQFLREEVNLDQGRLARLETALGALDAYLRDHLPGYQKTERQGSYALGTLIKPVDHNDEYDADIQIVVKPKAVWEPQDYLKEVYRTLASNKTYADKLTLKTRCVTVDYAGDFHLDLVPLVTFDGKHHVCNRRENRFEETDGNGYRDWFNEKNRITGGNLKRVVRLLKYLRDHKNSFTAKSILLTTLAGNTIRPDDEGTAAVSTVPNTLETVLSRMNDYLQQHPNMPEIKNPVLPKENFNRHWGQPQYANFRNRVQTYASTGRQARHELAVEKAMRLLQGLIRESLDSDGGSESTEGPETTSPSLSRIRS